MCPKDSSLRTFSFDTFAQRHQLCRVHWFLRYLGISEILSHRGQSCIRIRLNVHPLEDVWNGERKGPRDLDQTVTTETNAAYEKKTNLWERGWNSRPWLHSLDNPLQYYHHTNLNGALDSHIRSQETCSVHYMMRRLRAWEWCLNLECPVS